MVWILSGPHQTSHTVNKDPFARLWHLSGAGRSFRTRGPVGGYVSGSSTEGYIATLTPSPLSLRFKTLLHGAPHHRPKASGIKGSGTATSEVMGQS